MIITCRCHSRHSGTVPCSHRHTLLRVAGNCFQSSLCLTVCRPSRSKLLRRQPDSPRPYTGLPPPGGGHTPDTPPPTHYSGPECDQTHRHGKTWKGMIITLILELNCVDILFTMQWDWPAAISRVTARSHEPALPLVVTAAQHRHGRHHALLPATYTKSTSSQYTPSIVNI